LVLLVANMPTAPAQGTPGTTLFSDVYTLAMPEARAFAPGLDGGGRTYLFGGESSGASTLSSILRYEGNSKRATNSAQSLPTQRAGATATFLEWGNQGPVAGYIAGGVLHGQYTAEILRFEFATEKISVAQSRLPSPRAFAASTGWSDGMLILGGDSPAGMLSEILFYRHMTGEVTSQPVTLTTPLAGAAATQAGSQEIFLFGGYAGSGGTVPTKGILRYDPNSNSVLTMGATLPTPRAHMAAAWNGNRIILAGGSATANGVTTFYDDVFSYDPSTDRLETLPVKLPSPRAGMYATWYGSVLYLLGGIDANGPSKEIMRVAGFEWNFRFDESRVEIKSGESKLVSGTVTSSSYSGNINFNWGQTPFAINAQNLNVGPGQSVRFFIDVGVGGGFTGGTYKIVINGNDNRGTSLETILEVVVPGDEGFAAVLPSPREGTAAAYGGGGRFFVFGGRENTLDEVVEYDAATDESRVVARLPVALAGLSAVAAEKLVDGNRTCDAAGCPIYLFGGWSNDHNAKNYILGFDPATNTVALKRMALPKQTSEAAVAWVPEVGAAFIFGGADREGGTRYDQIVRYDPVKDEVWTMGAKLPRALFQATAVAHDGKVLIFGGEDTSDVLRAEILEYDPGSDTITTKGSTLPTPTSAMAGVLVEDRIILFGGTSGSISSSILRYDPKTDALESLDLSLPVAAGWASGATDARDGTTLIFGGRKSDGSATNGIMKFDGERLLGGAGTRIVKADWLFKIEEAKIALSGQGDLKAVKGSVIANNYSGAVRLNVEWPQGIDVRPASLDLVVAAGRTEEFFFNVEHFGKENGEHGITFRAQADRGEDQERPLLVTLEGGDAPRGEGRPGNEGADTRAVPADPGGGFSDVGTLPSARQNAAAVRWADGSIYFIGGSSSGDEILLLNTNRGDEDAAERPAPLVAPGAVAARLPEPLVARGAVLYVPPGRDGKCDAANACTILIMGGMSNGTPSSAILSWAPGDAEVVKRSAVLPQGRSHFAAVYHEGSGRAYLLGGLAAGASTDSVLIYDAAKEEVSPGARLPFPVYQSSAVLLGDKILVFGGRDSEARDEIIEYDIPTDSVSLRSARLPAATWGSAAFVADGKAYILGGAAQGTGSSITRYDPVADVATTLNVNLPTQLSGAAMAYDPGANKIYLAGGEIVGSGATATILSVDVATLTDARAPQDDLLGQLLAPVAAVTLAGGVGYVATNPKMRARIGALTTRVFRPREGFPSRSGGPTRYVIERELGKGGAGAAYLARDELLGRKVVIKKIFSKGLGAEARDMLLREARSASMVTHANLVTIYDVTQLEGQDVLVMEYVPGGSLEDALKRGRMEESVAILMTTRVLRGLAALHRAGIVHRDMKPGNILLTGELMPKISDMGIARAPGEAHLSMPGVQPGTLLYMSPEQARGEEIDQRSDLYSIAAVIYELLTGKFYLGQIEQNEYSLRKAIVESPPVLPLENVRAGLNAILEKALAKRPADRFQSADELRSALESLADWDPGKTATN
jgi:N-acetylneuraminic acid mutarotase/tRNA A-37 threonylcarbamoyl transferase component Bud32